MKIILTGANGNLGKRIQAHSTFECLPVSRSDWHSVEKIAPSEYQAVIHCAYDLKTDINERPDVVLESNVVSTGKALRLCKEKRIPRFIFISSCSVYVLDAEATVVAHLPVALHNGESPSGAVKGKYAGMVGALQMELPDGRHFALGSGLTDALRRDPPPVGTLITYRYRELTQNGMPRFPRYLRVRDKL